MIHCRSPPGTDESAVAPLAQADEGYAVETVESADTLLDRLGTDTFDCVVSAYELAEDDGISLCETVRAEFPDLPFVLYTDQGSEAIASDAISAGVSEYLRTEDAESESKLTAAVESAIEREAPSSEAISEGYPAEPLLETVPGCVVKQDRDGRFTYANERAQAVLGLAHSSDSEHPFTDPEWEYSDLVGDEIPEKDRPYRQVWESGEALYDFEHAIQRPDGTRTYLSVNGAPQFDDAGDVESVVLSLTDVTEQKTRERKLERYRQIVQHLDDIATIISPTGTIRYVSPAVDRVLGYEPDELIGDDGFGCQPPETSEAVAAGIQQVLEEPSEPCTVQTQFRRADGSVCWIESTLRNRTEDDIIDGILVSSRDISERVTQKQHTEQRKEQVSQLHEATRELLAAETPKAAATVASDAAVEILGLPLNGIHFYDEELDGLVPTAVSEGSTRLFDEVPIIDGGIAWEMFQRGETRIYDDIHDAGEVFNPETPIRSEMYLTLGEYGVFLVSSTETDSFDETDVEVARILAANTEAALHRITREQQLRSRERELEQQNERLDEFASFVSHDLRNPLNVAKGRLELAQSDCDSEHLEYVETAHDRMEDLINDILALSRQGKTIDEKDIVDVDSLARDSWQSVESADATQVVQTDLSIRADRSRLRQLLENLFRNAIEHGGDDVTVRIGEQEGGFYVADDGPGIPAGEREAVFTAGHSSGSGGTGYGLAIVDQIADGHDWEISIAESEAGGARFEITGVETDL